MNRQLISLLGLALVSLNACVGVGYAIYESDNQSTGVLLAETGDAANRRNWLVFPGSRDSDPRVLVSTTRSQNEPDLGISVANLSAEQAQALGREPFSAVAISRVQVSGAAAAAGLTQGDLITAVAGRPVTNPEQFAYVFFEEAQIDQALEMTVVPRRRSGTKGDGSVAITVIPQGVKSTESSTEAIPMSRSDGILRYTGLEAAVIDSSVAKQIYGTAQPVPIVTGVYTGSPAYLAGLRCGDRILSIDGVPADSLQPMKDAVLAMLRRDEPGAPILDLHDSLRGAFPTVSEDKESIAIEVDSAVLGPHLAELQFDPDYDDSSGFYLPILFNYESSRTRSESGFLNFIFTFGYDHESRLYPSATREPVKRSRTKILPLGLIDIESGPHKTEWSLLWFINWETRK